MGVTLATSTAEKPEVGFKVSQFIANLGAAFSKDELQTFFRATEKGLFCNLSSIKRLLSAFELTDSSGQLQQAKLQSLGGNHSDKSVRRLFGSSDYPLYYLVEGKSALLGALIPSEYSHLKSLGLVPFKGMPLAAKTLLHPRDPLFDEPWIKSQVTPSGVAYLIEFINSSQHKSTIRLLDSQLSAWCLALASNPRHAEKVQHHALREAVIVLKDLLASSKTPSSHSRILHGLGESNSLPKVAQASKGEDTSIRFVDGQAVVLRRVESVSKEGVRHDIYELVNRFQMVRSLTFSTLSKELQGLFAKQEMSFTGNQVIGKPAANSNHSKRDSGNRQRGNNQRGNSTQRPVLNSARVVPTAATGSKWTIKRQKGELYLQVVVEQLRTISVHLPTLLSFCNTCLSNPECLRDLPKLFSVSDLIELLSNLMRTAARVELRHLDPELLGKRSGRDEALLRRDGWVFCVGTKDGVLHALFNEKAKVANAPQRDRGRVTDNHRKSGLSKGWKEKMKSSS
jgi:hypothetical protein